MPKDRVRKLISFDADLLRAAHEYSRESGHRLDDIYDAAMRAYLKVRGQPVGLKEAFEQSARQVAANDRTPAKRKRPQKRS